MRKKAMARIKGRNLGLLRDRLRLILPLLGEEVKTTRDTVLEVSNQPLWLNRSSRHPRYLERRNPN